MKRGQLTRALGTGLSLLLIGLGLCGAWVGLSHAQSPAAYKVFCGNTIAGRHECNGYYTNTDFYFTHNQALSNQYPTDGPVPGVGVLTSLGSSGMAFPASMNSAAQFEAQLAGYVKQGIPNGCASTACYTYTWDAVGAATIINVMLGANSSALCGGKSCTWKDGIAYASSHLSQWETTVSTYDQKGWVSWDRVINVPLYEPDLTHVCGSSTGAPAGDCQATPGAGAIDTRDLAWRGDKFPEAGVDTITFFNPNGTILQIRRSCGNLVGSEQQLTPPPPSATASCAGYVLSILTPDPNQAFNVKVSIQISPSSAASTAFGPDKMSAQLTGPFPYAGASTTTGSPTIVNGIATTTLAVPATNVSGTFHLNWQLSGPQPPSASCSGTISIAQQPYFDVVGGDVSAGQGFGNPCMDNTSADITGANMDNGTTPGNYFGAGSRQGAIATGSVSSFATDATNNFSTNTAIGSDGIAADMPGGLLGANSSPHLPVYGGGFLGSSGTNWCVPDYVSGVGALTSGTTLPNLSTLPPGSGAYVYRIPAGQTVPGFQLPAGVHVTVIAAGNVFVSGNITYGSYTALKDVPGFALMTQGGGIYISSSVTELHGFYDAQTGGSGTGGGIYTCSTSIGIPATGYSACNTSLTIYGAVAAKQVVFGRTAGNIEKMASVANVPAEQIIYSPEVWLSALSGSQPSCAQDPSQSQCTYQAYSSLPPTL